MMPMKDRVELSRQAVDSILSKTRGISYDIMIVDNGSTRPETLAWLEAIQADPRVSLMCDDSPFNYAALNNAAVARTDAPLIGLINNDIEALDAGWLAEMAALADRPGTGCVGAKLHYPDGRIQHGGVMVGMGCVAGHAHHLWLGDDPGYCGRLMLRQTLSAVTAACLLVRRETYLAVGGMNETDLKVAFNDVDFCLKVRAAGFDNCWTPFRHADSP
jgi:GT2 family glycosyltransferase